MWEEYMFLVVIIQGYENCQSKFEVISLNRCFRRGYEVKIIPIVVQGLFCGEFLIQTIELQANQSPSQLHRLCNQSVKWKKQQAS